MIEIKYHTNIFKINQNDTKKAKIISFKNTTRIIWYIENQ